MKPQTTDELYARRFYLSIVSAYMAQDLPFSVKTTFCVTSYPP